MINSIFIKHNSAYKRIRFEEIEYIKANKDYLEIWTKERRFTIHGTLTAIQKNLHPGKFILIHRSYLINADKITEIENKTNSMVIFLGSHAFKVPTKRKSEVLSKLNIA